MTNIKKNRITYEYFFKKQFYGTEGNLLDLSNLFSDYKLIYYPENKALKGVHLTRHLMPIDGFFLIKQYTLLNIASQIKF